MKRIHEKTKSILACAKINLCLNICGQESNGLHYLDSILAKIPIYDEITLAYIDENIVDVNYLGGECYKRDSVKKLLSAMRSKYQLPGIRVTINKKIPEGSGLGGSSADAAAIAREIAKDFAINLPNSLLLEVGSDVPGMFNPFGVRIRGKGEHVEEVELKKKLYTCVSVNRNLNISTKEVYDLYDSIGGEMGNTITFLRDLAPFNSLERAAQQICPNIILLKEFLKNIGFQKISMTGSGTSYFGFTTDIKEYEKIQNNYNYSKQRGEIETYWFVIGQDGVAKSVTHT